MKFDVKYLPLSCVRAYSAVDGSIKSTVAHAPPDLNIIVPHGKFLLLIICLSEVSSKPRMFRMNSNLLIINKMIKKDSVWNINLGIDFRTEKQKEKKKINKKKKKKPNNINFFVKNKNNFTMISKPLIRKRNVFQI